MGCLENEERRPRKRKTPQLTPQGLYICRPCIQIIDG